jgi:hypothetical protein
MRRVMNWARHNPDRDFSADRLDDKEAQELRDLLKSNEIASMFDEVIRWRVGDAIRRAVFDQNKQYW